MSRTRWTLSDMAGENYWTRHQDFDDEPRGAAVRRFRSLAAAEEEAARQRRRGIHLKPAAALDVQTAMRKHPSNISENSTRRQA